MEEPTILYGIVNGATYADNLADAVTQAQVDGYKTVYIPAGPPYELNGTKAIEIFTSGFTLAGAGVGNTVLKFSKMCGNNVPQCGIYVHPQDPALSIEGVRLVGFTIQAADISPGGPQYRLGGINITDCRGAVVERVHAQGWRGIQNQPGYGFKAYHSGQSSDIIGETVFQRCSGAACLYGIWLAGAQPMQRCSIVCASFSAPADSAGYGICVQQAKGTLVLGGEFSQYQYGICLAPPNSTINDVQLTQILGGEFQGVAKGVYIGVGAKQTQVFGVTRSGDINQVADFGTNSLILSHHVDDPYQNNALVLTHQHRSQFPLGVDVIGLMDAAVLTAPSAGVRTYKVTNVSLSKNALDDAFGHDAPPGFIGICQDGNNNYLVVKGENGQWFSSSELSRVTTP
jgi:nitrous oxidase accessory protein NosD